MPHWHWNNWKSFITFCEYFRLNTSECFTLGDVTTVNMTMVKGGVAYNVIPAEMDVSFDMRIPPTVNLPVCRLKVSLAKLISASPQNTSLV